MVHTVLYGVNGGMEVDVVVIFIDGSLLAFTDLLARMARQYWSAEVRVSFSVSPLFYIHSHHPVLPKQPTQIP